MDLETVGVIGAGVIGIGVAESLATAGFRVLLVDISHDRIDAAMQKVLGNLRAARLFGSGNGERAENVIGRITPTISYDLLHDVSFVIENVTEKWAVKEPVYQRLDAICIPECVFAANTSAIPITHIGVSTGRADRVIGIHFMNPVPRKDTVEVIVANRTSKETLERAHSLLARMGKKGIVVHDAPGFVSNRVLMLTINEAISTVQECVASHADVDRIFRECFGHPMGPLETADLIGLDTVLDTLEVLAHFTGEAKFHPCQLLRSMVESGACGRKNGKGFYQYD